MLVSNVVKHFVAVKTWLHIDGSIQGKSHINARSVGNLLVSITILIYIKGSIQEKSIMLVSNVVKLLVEVHNWSHIQESIQEKKHQCQHCDKCFSEKGHLVKHGKIHTGEAHVRKV